MRIITIGSLLLNAWLAIQLAELRMFGRPRISVKKYVERGMAKR